MQHARAAELARSVRCGRTDRLLVAQLLLAEKEPVTRRADAPIVDKAFEVTAMAAPFVAPCVRARVVCVCFAEVRRSAPIPAATKADDVARLQAVV